MKFHSNFFNIILKIRNTLIIDDIFQKVQGIEFNLAPTKEDKKIGFKQGYKAVVAHHHIDSSGQIGVEYFGVVVDT